MGCGGSKPGAADTPAPDAADNLRVKEGINRDCGTDAKLSAMTRARFVDSIANDAVVKCKHQSPLLLRLRSPLIPLSVRAQTIRPVLRQA